MVCPTPPLIILYHKRQKVTKMYSISCNVKQIIFSHPKCYLLSLVFSGPIASQPT